MPIRSRDASMVPPEMPSGDLTELEQLVVDDSDGDGEDDNALAKTSSALNVVRTKLIRHISHENEPSRRSRASAGHSREEVARRAELRRFRHQRIQEELKNEESNAESSSTSHRSTRYLSPLIDPGQPGVGPRDAIEFTVTDGHHLTTAQAPPTKDVVPSAIQQEKMCDAMQTECTAAKPPSTGAVPDTEGEDQAHPLRPPSTHSAASQKMAGCSYNVPRLGRVLGADNEFEVRHGAYAWEEQSSLSIWLAAQGLRSRSSSVRPRDSETNGGNVRDQAPSPYEDFGGIDSAADALLPTHRQDMNKVKPHDQVDSFESTSFHSSLSNNGAQAHPTIPPSFQAFNPAQIDPNLISIISPQRTWKVLSSHPLAASEEKSSYATAEDDVFYSDNNASTAQINCTAAEASVDANPMAYQPFGSKEIQM
ncbi:glutathione-dependent formaldehyde-activating enzyme [Trichoderma cornu-damae]|uniref:Glutathione-dependent formaldehyde-activating enzyme n=1 Tax=Trichoderma cornu-damae TaxID=654480 RepID=A0A9P8QJZ1_9HYPO|nr:glutathione-dependent formaldehyde-activating enzyme [Trichoderma cornu-damae]